MKHLLNNLTEEEKNSIREQHTGGMKISNEKFSMLVESKQGDVKPFLTEQKNDWVEVVKFVKSKGVRDFKFKEGIEGLESQGIILTNPKDKTLEMWIQPKGTYTIYKQEPKVGFGRGVESGKWKFDNKMLKITPEDNFIKMSNLY